MLFGTKLGQRTYEIGRCPDFRDIVMLCLLMCFCPRACSETAGFDVMRIVSEPAAICLAHGQPLVEVMCISVNAM